MKKVKSEEQVEDTMTPDTDVFGELAEPLEETLPIVESVVRIAPFSGNLGREDLNQLVSKVNEVIDFINKQ